MVPPVAPNKLLSIAKTANMLNGSITLGNVVKMKSLTAPVLPINIVPFVPIETVV